ncbi:hypothetical protein BT96DRAFT_1002157 [Gymnopus androsaceus JB14]|uniref:Uncharacterized protein n=1 Tax=Gymnopus androsaceus JB14 TaxID=1447944 RepID=A0A6A4GZN8_9AGAR|nr:hypothetical protein BT96DRAFT_1002157 [Gymnopus androsaceus JB14]
MSNNCNTNLAALPLRRSARLIRSKITLASKLTQQFRDFQRQLRNGKLLTFNSTKEVWEDWMPPVAVAISGAMTAANPGLYHQIPGYIPPRCAHVLDPSLCEQDYTMVVTIHHHKGFPHYILKAPHKGCEFKMKLTFKEEKLHDFDDDLYTQDSDDIDLIASSECSYSAPSTPTSLSSSVSSFSSPSSDSSSSQSRPQPRPLTGPRKLTSFFNEQDAKARASPDYALISTWKSAYQARCFQDFPVLHPASSSDTPKILFPYDPTKVPNLCATIDSHLQYFDTAIGRLIRALNGNYGITELSFNKLLSFSYKCSGCLCEFSPDGYISHLGYHGLDELTPCCLNMTSCPPVTKQFVITETRLPKVVADFSPALNIPAGRPFLAWNSRLGVPADVWALISTGVVTCSGCGLVRTFAGDNEHYASGLCG